MPRGYMTDEEKAELNLPFETTRDSIRLMCTLHNALLNSGTIRRERINRDDNRMLQEWEKLNLISTHRSTDGISIEGISEDFYDQVSLVMKYAYAGDFIDFSKK